MLKTTVRLGVARLARLTGLLRLAESRLTNSLTIVCYHRVLPEELKRAYAFPDLAVTPEAFRVHCAALARHYEVHALSEAADLLRKGYRGKRPLAAVTFDDGYRDNHAYAVPVLDSYGLKATFFVIAGLVGKSELPWYDRLKQVADGLARDGKLEESLADVDADVRGVLRECLVSSPGDVVQAAKRLKPGERTRLISRLASLSNATVASPGLDTIMNAEELKALRRSGHEIGSHSVSHEILPLLDEASRVREISGSKDLLERAIEGGVRCFCYPNGDYDGSVLESVEEAGYSYACTTRKGINHTMATPFELRRWFIKESALASARGAASSTLFRLELAGLADRVFLRGRHRKPVS